MSFDRCRSVLPALVAALLGCSDGQEPSEPPSRIAVITFIQGDTVMTDVGGVGNLDPQARDTAGSVVPNAELTYEWRSAHPEIAEVGADGLIRGLSVGTTEISATAEGVTGTIIAQVFPSTITSLSLSPETPALLPRSAVQVTTAFRDASGARISVQDQREVLWSSSDLSIVTVQVSQNAEGVARAVVTALGPGQAEITARRGDVSASAVVQVASEAFVAVDVAYLHSCARTVSSRTFCWGVSTLGELGGGLPDLRCDEYGYCSLLPLLVAGPEHFAQIALGGRQSCGITADADLFCWGGGLPNTLRPGVGGFCEPVISDLQLECVPTPEKVELSSPVQAVAPGGEHACLLTAEGSAWCWGDGSYGQLGSIPTSLCMESFTGQEFPCSRTPIPIDDTTHYTAIAAGSYHTCGLTTKGRVRCWGTVPVTVVGDHQFSAISVGGGTNCALVTDGTAYCWGDNRYGQIGAPADDGCPPEVIDPIVCEPVALEGPKFDQISVGALHSCGVGLDGTGYCWGENSRGQLGTGTTESSTIPVPVSGGLVFRQLVAGTEATCGITTATVVYCWGWNTYGQVGDGTRTDRLVPTRIAPS